MPDKSYDAIPSMASAIVAHRRAAGDKGSKFYKSFENAMKQITTNYGPDAASQLMDVVLNTNKDLKGDANKALSRYAKDKLATKGVSNEYVRNFLAVADQNNNTLDKFTYGFDLPAETSEADLLTAKIAAILNK